MNDFSRRIEDEFQQQAAEVRKPNLMVVGGTGVGKSSLINRVFGAELARTGSGEPVTRGCIRYECDGIPLVVFDTEGYEVAQGDRANANFQQVVIPEVRRRKAASLNEQVHLVWYCMSVANHRVTPFDLDNLALIRAELGLPVAVVLTQCDSEPVDAEDRGVTSAAFRQALADAGHALPVFETSASHKDLKLQLEELIAWSSESLTDEGLRQSFVAAQRASLSVKRSEAQRIVALAAAASGASAGLNPLPMSDALLIVPQQLVMAAALARVYGFESLGSHVMGLLKGHILSLVGRQLAASLTKFIPVLGQVINAGVATVITGGLGYALMQAYETAYEYYLKHSRMPDWAQIFSDQTFSKLLAAGMDSWKSANR